jgi:hypothetical protein
MIVITNDLHERIKIKTADRLGFESPVHSDDQSQLIMLSNLYKNYKSLVGFRVKKINIGSNSLHPISQVNKPNVNKPKSKKQKYRLKGSRDKYFTWSTK